MTHSLPTRLSFDIFTHEAVGLSDALGTFEGPVIELHISNPYAREEWRHTSVVAPVATGSICGLGGHGYALSVAAVARPLAGRKSVVSGKSVSVRVDLGGRRLINKKR